MAEVNKEDMAEANKEDMVEEHPVEEAVEINTLVLSEIYLSKPQKIKLKPFSPIVEELSM
jgi:hypothetical protein